MTKPTQKVVISVDGVKREISPPFQMCLSRDMARALRAALRQADHDDFTYGWITVPAEPSADGGPPLPWRDPAR